MGQKVLGRPWEIQPSPPQKKIFQKHSALRKYTTSKFSSSPKIRRGSYPDDSDKLREIHHKMIVTLLNLITL